MKLNNRSRPAIGRFERFVSARKPQSKT
jgi:hypothetical protein